MMASGNLVQNCKGNFPGSHVGMESMVASLLDMKLPNQNVGQLRPEILTVP
jgi:hypothetical protein